MFTDFIFILQWWVVLFVLGLIFLPLTRLVLKNSPDSFYIFSKILGVALVSYAAFILGLLHILPFTLFSILGIVICFLLANAFIIKKNFSFSDFKITKIIVFEEVLFFVGLCAWAYVRAHEPSIHSLEKFMDYGFLNSILRSTYFPPKDMWFTPFSINYYYFGHVTTAVLTKLSGLPSNITYNLMIATLFAFTLTGAFSLVFNLLEKMGIKKAFMGGLLGGLLLSIGGNLHTLYAFFSPYTGDHPVPFWTLQFLPLSYPNAYWYPNATRFIPFTIHEFPLYSFVVSDLHGHVIDIPFVLFTLALTFSILTQKAVGKLQIVILSLFLAIMYMTNAWDGLIYLLLSCIIFFVLQLHHIQVVPKKARSFFPQKIRNIKTFLLEFGLIAGGTALLFVFFTLPFSVHFKPFVSGIGVVCAPNALTDIKLQKTQTGEFIPGKVGPLLFEKDHCQKSPIWQLATLYGFFYFYVICFLLVLLKKVWGRRNKTHATQKTYSYSLPPNTSNTFIVILIIVSTILIAVPEFLYAKDIYPAHYRANTMFKLVYEAYIMLTISATYIIVYLISKKQKFKLLSLRSIFIAITILLLSLVFVYPYFAIKSYYGDLNEYKGLNGTNYLLPLHPGDLEAISYLNEHLSGQPVILEAQGDSYTDFGRISSNTGLPTVLGWTVHEWLWRGSYDTPAPRIEEVRKMYEENESVVLPLLKKYNVSYVVVGDLEREKYPRLQESIYKKLGKEIFKSRDLKTTIYQLPNYLN